MGTVTVADTFVVASWTSVTFAEPFRSAPLVFALPTNEGSDPATLRIRNVSTTGFEIVQTEPGGNDGPHVAMNTAYLAIEAGNWQFPDGTRITAQELTTTAFANRFISVTWQSVSFPAVFPSSPAVLTQIQTTTNEALNPPASSAEPFMDVSLQNLGPASAQITLERAESIAGTLTTPESVAVLAIEDQANVSFVDSSGTAVQLQAILTPDNVVGWSNGCVANGYPVSFSTSPIAVASVNSRDGNNGGWVRRCSESAVGLGLAVDEDEDNDSERSHTSERAGIVAASTAFHANFDVELNTAKRVATVSDPVNGVSGPKAIPDAVVQYTIAIENRGSISPDADSLIITDDIPEELSMCVSNLCQAGGPVVLDTSGSPVAPGIAVGLIEYSDDGGVSYAYVPTPDAGGFDAQVDAVRITLTGTLASIATAGVPSFELLFAAKVE